MLVSFVTAKGSPGGTTAAVAVAAIGARQRERDGRSQGVDFVELDPAGGDVEVFTGAFGESGLLSAAPDLRPEVLADHVVEAPRGLRSLLAPVDGNEAHSTVIAATEMWGPVLATASGVVIADLGRWEANQASAARVEGSDLVVVVCRPEARSVAHAHGMVAALRQRVRPTPVVVVTIGDRPHRSYRPYPLDEVAAVLGVPPAGSLAWDPKGAAALWSEGASRRWSKSFLAKSARRVLDELMSAAQGPPLALPPVGLSGPAHRRRQP